MIINIGRLSLGEFFFGRGSEGWCARAEIGIWIRHGVVKEPIVSVEMGRDHRGHWSVDAYLLPVSIGLWGIGLRKVRVHAKLYAFGRHYPVQGEAV